MGGSKEADTIENLMGLCRKCHNAFGDKTQHKEMLKAVHNHHLSKRVI
jgi:5-methylcytosine-specific restriction endonuclease McrA